MVSAYANPTTGPTPGCVINSRTSGRCSASARTARSSSPTCSCSRSSIASRSLRRRAPAFAAPQTALAPHALVQRQVLQLILHLRANFHQLLPVPQQLPHIAHLRAGHPQPGKPSVDQQIQNMLGIATVGLLLPHHQPPNLRRISDPQLVPHLGQHLLEPLRVAHRFHPHAHRLSLECSIESQCFSLLVFQSTFPQFAGLGVDHGNLLVARMKITSYNLHCGSFLPSLGLGDSSVLARLSEPHFVIQSNEVRNPSVLETQEKRDSSARSVPRFTVNGMTIVDFCLKLYGRALHRDKGAIE